MHAQDFVRSFALLFSRPLKKSIIYIICIIMATIDIRRHPMSFWTTRMDITTLNEVDQDWHSMGPAELAFHLEGLRHLNLARPELERMYATGARVQIKLVVTWDITKDEEPSTHSMRLVPFHLANPGGRIAVRPAELPWRSIMARIKSDVRNRMEYVRNAPSNTRFHRISKMEVHIVPTGGTPALAADGSGAAIVLPNRGGTYKELPETLLKKRACINIQNTDYRCFQYCIMNWVSNWYKGRGSLKWPR